MLRASLILLLIASSILPSMYGAKTVVEQFEELARDFECKGEKVNKDLLMSLMNKNCKKEMGTNFGCAFACYYKTLGLYEDGYRYFEDEDKTIERIVKTKIMNKKLVKMFVEPLKDSTCKSKFPSKGADGCAKAIKGTACISLKINKFCDSRMNKLIAADS